MAAPVLDKVFSLKFTYGVGGCCSSGFSPCGLGQMIFCAEGAHLVIGVHTSVLKGCGYKANEESFEKFESTIFEELVDEKMEFFVV